MLYRDRSGTLGLIDSVCAHRRAHLSLGVPEDKGLRCPYHGWRWRTDGAFQNFLFASFAWVFIRACS